jgi:diaminobutyrate-2-oxoglutarate transaminase
METAGPSDEVAKMLPPLTTTVDEFAQGLEILGDAVDAVCT